MIDKVHVALEPREDLLIGIYARAGVEFGQDNAAIGGDLADALESRDGLFLVAHVEQPVGADNGLISHVITP
jgi:hypothetical protein